MIEAKYFEVLSRFNFGQLLNPNQEKRFYGLSLTRIEVSEHDEGREPLYTFEFEARIVGGVIADLRFETQFDTLNSLQNNADFEAMLAWKLDNPYSTTHGRYMIFNWNATVFNVTRPKFIGKGNAGK